MKLSTEGPLWARRTRNTVALGLATTLAGACMGELDGPPLSGGGAEARDGRLPARVWRLSPAQLDREIERLLGPGAPEVILPEGAPDHGITNIAASARIDDGNASVLAEGIRGVGVWAADNGASTSRCGAGFGSDACIDAFLDWFPAAAYRRPVAADERASLRALHDELRTAIDADYAYAGLVRAVLLSPEFLYRTELGPIGSASARTTLTQHEIATLLAFTVTDRAPDEALLDAAARGALTDPDEREAQLRRLLPASGPVWQRFFWEWLHMDTLRSQAVEVGLSDTLRGQMEEEYAAFVDDVVVGRHGSFGELFSAPYTFVQPELAMHYGAAHPGSGLQRIDLDPSQRGGLLTQGAWLVAHGKRGRDNVVRRGMNIYREMMCNDVMAPGIDLEAALAALVPEGASVRETSEIRGSAGTCAGCHRLADPAGLVFESYASDGRWQDTYADGRPVEPQIDLAGLGAFDRAPDFSAALTEEPQVRFCMVQRFAAFALGRDLGPAQQLAWTRDAQRAMRNNDDRLEELLVALVRHPAFVERATTESP
jgi:hypothetical protein